MASDERKLKPWKIIVRCLQIFPKKDGQWMPTTTNRYMYCQFTIGADPMWRKMWSGLSVEDRLLLPRETGLVKLLFFTYSSSVVIILPRSPVPQSPRSSFWASLRFLLENTIRYPVRSIPSSWAPSPCSSCRPWKTGQRRTLRGQKSCW